eukprot:1424430-Pyramimonas_sp.AAC.1
MVDFLGHAEDAVRRAASETLRAWLAQDPANQQVVNAVVQVLIGPREQLWDREDSEEDGSDAVPMGVMLAIRSGRRRRLVELG